MRRILAATVLMLSVAVLAGCATSSAGIAPSTRPLAPDEYTVMNSSSGTSWGVSVLGFLPLKQANTAAALDEALCERGADALVQATVDNRTCCLIIVTLHRIKVEGLAVRTKS